MTNFKNYFYKAGNETLEVVKYFERRGESLVEVISGHKIGMVFYVKSEQLYDEH